MLRKPQSNPAFLASDFDSFKEQETIFVILNLFILATLLLVQVWFDSHWGAGLVRATVILAVSIAVLCAELFWLRARSTPLSLKGMARLTWGSICFGLLLAVVLGAVNNREDTQYYVVMVVPVLVAAYRLTLPPTIAVAAVVDCINFFFVWRYAQHLDESPVNEYIEAGAISLIYTVVGVLVWLLVDHLRQKEARLTASLADLQRTKDRLVQEERLAAVGRLASGIAHEIRNPVSAIVSAVATTRESGVEPSVREEMFEIAAKESRRLETLTTDFLAYARPRNPEKAPTSLDDTLGYVADACRPRAKEKGVSIQAHPSGGLVAEIDPGYVQQALVDLVINAVEASSPGGRVDLRAAANRDGSVQIDVENAGSWIPPAAVARIFEPFFTTKARGTGLGLAIAHNIARAHGGELFLSVNEPGRVCFSLTFPAAEERSSAA